MEPAQKFIRKRRVPIPLIIILSIALSYLTAFGAFYAFGMHLHNEARIYPNVLISGIVVSGMTRSEAAQTLNVPDYTERVRNASVTLVFPDGTEVRITGIDAMLQHDAYVVLFEAYNIGRTRGVLPGVISYAHMRFPNTQEISFEIDVSLDADLLRQLTDAITYAYNARLDASTPNILSDRIVFTKGAGHINADADEIFSLVYHGLFESFENSEPVEIRYMLTPADAVIQDIIDIRSEVFAVVISSKFDPETNSATASTVGVDFDIIAAAALIRDMEYGETVEFELLFTYPEYSQEELASLLFRDLIGERTTFVHGSSARVHNVGLSAEKINEHVLLPGEEFSFNRVVGRRTGEAGFQAAPAIVSGEMVNVRGGGVCQTSSTLFASIKPSELNVTQQRSHTRSVPYLPRGWDAAVWYPSLDFRFENNTNYPLLLIMELYDRQLTARVYGTIINGFPIAAEHTAERTMEQKNEALWQ